MSIRQHTGSLAAYALLAALCPASGTMANQLSEGFNLAAGPALPAGWIARNQSTSPGTGNNTNCFYIATIGGVGSGVNSWPVQEGTGMAYATFACASGVNPVSGFLISPAMTGLQNGVTIGFQTRADTLSGPTRPDRLQVLLCLGATCGDADSTGSIPTDLGQYSTILLDINPTQISGVYPVDWTLQTVTLAGLPAGANAGRIAFRFVAPNGGPSGNQGSRVGIDAVVVSDAPAAVVAAPAWSNDPANNLMIADRNGEETQTKILPRADGGFYISWFDNTDGGYDLRVQRLDGEGRELWPHNGVLVADRNYSSTTDYGFSIDTAGNALLSFQCCTPNTAEERIVAAKVNPDGGLAWGPNGVAVSTPGEGQLVSYLSATSDGSAVIAWLNDAGTGRVQKLDANGLPLWGATGTSLPGPAAGAKFISDVKPGLNGDAIVSWSNQAGSARVLRAQKLASADGSALWGTDGVLASVTNGLGSGNFPKMQVDGNGGVIFAYTDYLATAAYVRVQHLGTAGSRLLGDSGVLASTDTSRGHYAPSASYDRDSGDISLVWIDGQVVNQQSFDGLYAQRINSAGARLWGDSGRELVPMTQSTDGANALSQAVALPAPGGMLATWVTGDASVASNPISTVRLGPDGSLLWSQTAHIKTSATKTSRLSGATSVLGYATYVWSDAIDNTSSGLDIRGQNLQYTGAFGDTISRSGFDN